MSNPFGDAGPTTTIVGGGGGDHVGGNGGPPATGPDGQAAGQGPDNDDGDAPASQVPAKPGGSKWRKAGVKVIVANQFFTTEHKTLKFSNGDRYEGDFDMTHARYHGHGTFRWASGAVYTGGWWKGKRGGKGMLRSADGGVYEGEWRDNKREGQGVFTRADGAVYEGPWVDDKMSGDGGVFRYPNGDVYSGKWLEGHKHGRGEYNYAALLAGGGPEVRARVAAANAVASDRRGALAAAPPGLGLHKQQSVAFTAGRSDDAEDEVGGRGGGHDSDGDGDGDDQPAELPPAIAGHTTPVEASRGPGGLPAIRTLGKQQQHGRREEPTSDSALYHSGLTTAEEEAVAGAEAAARTSLAAAAAALGVPVRYRGQFAEGLSQGEGESVNDAGDRYFGGWDGGRRSGRGAYKWSEDGKVLRGVWAEGRANGVGLLTRPKPRSESESESEDEGGEDDDEGGGGGARRRAAGATARAAQEQKKAAE